jgi:hypothetical protein
MSAKSVQGPGGKKPASAATNLIGKLQDGNLKDIRPRWQNTDSIMKPVVALE